VFHEDEHGLPDHGELPAAEEGTETAGKGYKLVEGI